MNAVAPTCHGRLAPGVKLPGLSFSKLSTKSFRFCAASSLMEASRYIPAAPILLPEGPWRQIPGGVTAAEGFRAVGMFSGLRAKGDKLDLALVVCDDSDVDAISKDPLPRTSLQLHLLNTAGKP